MKTMKSPVDPKWDWHYKALLRIREKLLDERAEHEAAVRILRERGGEDDVDRANEKQDESVLLAEIHMEEAELNEVEAALDRLRKGTYGVCEVTGKPITLARLRALPWTRLSVEAAETLAKQSKAAAGR